MIHPIVRLASIALAGTAVMSTAALAQIKLPPTMTMTAYDTGTAGFNITVAIGKVMKDKYGSDVRVLPALQSTVVSVIWTACGPHSLVPNSNTPSCAK